MLLIDSMFARTAYAFIENPSINKEKSIRDDLFAMLGLLVKKYNHAVGISSAPELCSYGRYMCEEE